MAEWIVSHGLWFVILPMWFIVLFYHKPSIIDILRTKKAF